MSDEVKLLAGWDTVLADGRSAQLAIIGDRDGERIGMVAALGDDAAELLGNFYDEQSALRAGSLISQIIRMPEHARIGGDGVLTGADTDHPGVEWAVPGEVSDDPDPQQRLSAGGLRRLWVVPSTDGEVLGLLAPNTEPRDLGEFVTADAADTFIALIDRLIEDPRYRVRAPE
ncbi:MAG: hypothetical protein QM728_08415 [Gordonia sp. (in: high G+C Gram-positive bacteria)]|uniref:hypothetical protein n=1 Tax=Gordonia sp. (in: high G+C Gram-positive bacteria) TaxID=84139 RepID=UPI0039E64307